MKPDSRTGLPDANAAKRVFDRVGSSFDSADVVHSEARCKLLERLNTVDLTPRVIIDLGAATGKGTLALARRYPAARVLAADSSIRMLEQVVQRCLAVEHIHPVMSDAQCLPVASNSVDLIFANLILPWCVPETVLAEVSRVLVEGGLLVFTTVGPDTLQEVRNAWRKVDDKIHVHGFTDMHHIGDLVVRAGLVDPVMDVDRLEVTHTGLKALVYDLRACGATNVAVGRRTSLTGPDRWRRFEKELLYQGQERVSTTVELIFGQAWGSGRVREGDSANGTVRIPVTELTRSFRRR